MTRIAPWVACTATLALVSADASLIAQQSLRGRVFTDKSNGYQITIPKKWVRLPTNVDEKWIVGYFQSKKEWVGSAKAGDSLMGHKPYMKVILFDDAVIKRFVETYKEGDVTVKSLKHPYRDYKDYVKRHLSGGFFFAEEKAGTSRGLQVMKYQIKLEKLVQDKKRYIAWVFKGQGYKIAVEFEVLESQAAKLNRTVQAALSTFKMIPRAKNASATRGGVLDRTFTDEEWAKLSAKERMEFRKEVDKARQAKMLKRLPQGWTATKSKHFLVISHTSKKRAKRVMDAAEAFRAWLNKRYGKVSDEYAMKAVIRICKNAEEYGSYHTGSSETRFNFRNREIVLYNDFSNVGINSGGMFWQIYGFFMQDKAPELLFSAPVWLDSGLDNYVSGAILKGRKLVFQRSVAEFTAFAHLRRMKEGSIKTARELMDLDEVGTFRLGVATEAMKLRLGSQVATFFRFLEGPGRRLKFLRGKDFIVDYMQAVRATAKKLDRKAGFTLTGSKEATTEAEEEEQAEKSSQRWKEYAAQAKARRKEFLVTLRKEIDSWTPDQWKQLEKAYAAYHSKKTR